MTLRWRPVAEWAGFQLVWLTAHAQEGGRKRQHAFPMSRIKTPLSSHHVSDNSVEYPPDKWGCGAKAKKRFSFDYANAFLMQA